MIRILLADDHEIMRSGLRTMLEGHPSFVVVGEASDGREALRLAMETAPDVVLMDIGMPVLNGLEATRTICQQKHAPSVVILSMHSDRRFVTKAFESGARGYLLKAGKFDELVRALTVVAQGKTYVSPEVATHVIEELTARETPGAGSADGLSILSPREREVLQLVAEGRSTKETASMLGVSVKTVETHRRQVMHKLDIDSVAGLTKFAVREGITSVED